jgi:primosomal protein N'
MIVGLIESVLEESPFGSKALPIKETIEGIFFPESFLKLLTWTAARTFCSKPTVLKAWLRKIPKRHVSRSILRQAQDPEHSRGTYHAWGIENPLGNLA